MRQRSHSQVVARRWIAACGLLGLYLALFSPLGVAGVAGLGVLDADHQAFIRTGAGGLRLVLHHQASCARHQHHAVARALTIFAQPASATDPDHVVQFAGASGLGPESQPMLCGEDSDEMPLVFLAETIVNLPSHPVFLLPPPAPPPDAVGHLPGIRATVLLI